ncbi:hypothetical protein C5167_034924 [Papaver somniferum]|uniref:Uncharacterized protein n=1 Tax=Papaver somniferum TaxID=3469 RepID=A0A4Y7KFV0_PAPSO|nr:hypothetical protein C5167_034924 [Papaver somniferum]
MHAFHYAQKAPMVKVKNMKFTGPRPFFYLFVLLSLAKFGMVTSDPKRPEDLRSCIHRDDPTALYKWPCLSLFTFNSTHARSDGLTFCMFCTTLHMLQDAKLLFWLLPLENMTALGGHFSFIEIQVEKIFGPGNQVVTAAKMISRTVKRMVSVDMPAGSSEVLVIADKHAGPVHIAADLLSQRTRSNSANTGWYCVEAQSCMNDISYQVLTYVATSLFWLFSLFQSWASFSATLCLN